MKKAIILLTLSLVLGGFAFWTLRERDAPSANYSLPSPHREAGEQLFLTNVHIGAIWGWALRTGTKTLAVTRVPHNKALPGFETRSNTTTTSHTTKTVTSGVPLSFRWELTYTNKANKGTRLQEVAFSAERNEVLANARNFLSLAYVSEDTSDSSPLQALSLELALKASETVVSALDLTAISDTPAYFLTVKKPVAEPIPTATESVKPSDSFTTFIFLEGTAAAPLKKLYFRGKAYWVREWYVQALQREPEELYKKDFLNLSAHTLERVIKTLPDSVGIDFIFRLTAPYTWSLVDGKLYASQPAQLTKNVKISNSTRVPNPALISTNIETVSSDEEKVTAFIETLLFLKAERALVLLTHRERKRLTRGALEQLTFQLASRSLDTNAPDIQTMLRLYYYADVIYAETSIASPLYRLSTRKAYTLLHYHYNDFLAPLQ